LGIALNVLKCVEVENPFMTEERTASQNGTYRFTPAELERLYIFRQAVLAGFYTDQIDVRITGRSPKSDSGATRGGHLSASQN
jgi:hypothetical protein